jgi:selenocysteine lyase/cysteine desulfurase
VGAGAAVDFLAGLAPGTDRRAALATAFGGLHARAQALVQRLWEGLGAIEGVTLYGVAPDKPRTPTVAFSVAGLAADAVAQALARQAVFVSSGDFYATTVIERLGLQPGGVVRAGCACYTTPEEVERLIEGVGSLA